MAGTGTLSTADGFFENRGIEEEMSRKERWKGGRREGRRRGKEGEREGKEGVGGRKGGREGGSGEGGREGRTSTYMQDLVL